MQTALQYIQSELQGVYPETEIKSFGLLIVEKLTGFSRTQIIVNKNTQFSIEQQHEIEKIVDKLKNNVPIQYILGETEFYGLPFKVNESVLIPRPETEELVEWILSENTHENELTVLDIGTGSGCIAISLKKCSPTWSVEAFDISEKALVTATQNAHLNGVNLAFSEVDILNPPAFTNKKWDIIVSNPPYVLNEEKDFISQNVLAHEPHLALFVPDDDALLFYRHIAQFAKHHLNQNGKLYFEINRMFGEITVELLEYMGFSCVEFRKDISGNDRMIKAVFVG
jgi:release factor glutamine methyltransferase